MTKQEPDFSEKANKLGQITQYRYDDANVKSGATSRAVVDPRFFDVDEHDVTHYTPGPHFRRGEGGQGRLFAEQKWVRGYSQNRQARVNEMLATGGRPLYKSDTETRPIPIDTSEMRGWGRGAVKGRTKEAKQRRALIQESYKRELTEQLKRSTVPTEHLRGANFKVDPTGGYRGGSYDLYGGGGGQVRIQGESIRRRTEMNPQELEEHRAWVSKNFPGKESTTTHKYVNAPSIDPQTLVHEIGHHVDLYTTATHGPSATGEPMMKPEERALVEAHIRKGAKGNMPTKLVKEGTPAEREAWTQDWVQRRQNDYSGGTMFPTRTGLHEGAADVYRAQHRPRGMAESHYHSYSPHGIEMNVKSDIGGSHFGPGTVKQNVELAQSAYLLQHRRFGVEPSSKWDEERQKRGTTEHEDEQMRFF